MCCSFDDPIDSSLLPVARKNGNPETNLLTDWENGWDNRPGRTIRISLFRVFVPAFWGTI
jgi:hypothetical protein